MAITQKMQDALNEHTNQELYSSYLYLSMSSYCESINLPGFAHWLRIQSQEEYAHGMKIFDFINDRDGRAILHPIGQPTIEFESIQDVMQKTLEHERHVSSLINKLYEVAVTENDVATQIHLQWFITEQIEEEKTANDLVEQLKLISGQGDALLLLDRELGARSLDPVE
ncbi:MAG: ferritin [Dehalococcoidia bacterium]|nr:ferritin [Dehalococcoidia bacterium]